MVASSIQIINDTSKDIRHIKVDDMDEHDFYFNIGSPKDFNGEQVKSRGSLNKHVEMYKPASGCPYRMLLIFEDGSKEHFKIRQVYAKEGYDYVLREQDRNISNNREKDDIYCICNRKYKPSETLDETLDSIFGPGAASMTKDVFTTKMPPMNFMPVVTTLLDAICGYNGSAVCPHLNVFHKTHNVHFKKGPSIVTIEIKDNSAVLNLNLALKLDQEATEHYNQEYELEAAIAAEEAAIRYLLLNIENEMLILPFNDKLRMYEAERDAMAASAQSDQEAKRITDKDLLKSNPHTDLESLKDQSDFKWHLLQNNKIAEETANKGKDLIDNLMSKNANVYDVKALVKVLEEADLQAGESIYNHENYAKLSPNLNDELQKIRTIHGEVKEALTLSRKLLFVLTMGKVQFQTDEMIPETVEKDVLEISAASLQVSDHLGKDLLG